MSLENDPTVPLREARVASPKLFDVAWWRPLVKTGLLEYLPSEPARIAVDFDSERIVTTTRDGVIRCLSPAEGRIEWQYKTQGRFQSGATIDRGIAYVAGTDGFLRALRMATGEQIWEYNAGEELVAGPVLASGKVLIASQAEAVFAVDQQTGVWSWQYRRDAPSGFSVRGTAHPVILNDLVYMGFADGYLVALDLGDGVARWDRRLTVSGGTQFLDVDTSPIVTPSGKLFAASYKDGLVALDAKTGDTEWTTSQSGIVSIAHHDGILYSSGDGLVNAFDAATGKLKWTRDLSDKSSKGKGNNAGLGLTFGGSFLIAPTATALAFLDPVSGRVETLWNPGRGVSGIPTWVDSVRFGSRLYVLSNLGTVFALDMVHAGGT